MTNFEMVELLRQKANVSYEEAKAALEAANWDLLDAIVLLEKEGRVADGGAAYSTGTKRQEKSEKKKQSEPSGFRQGMRSLGSLLRRVLDYCNRNFVVASKNGSEILSLPLTAVVLLLFPLGWLMLILVVVGLFCGVRYSLRGEHPANEKVNDYIHKAESAVEHMKEEFRPTQENGQDDAKE